MCDWVFTIQSSNGRPPNEFCVKDNKFVGLGLKLSKIYLKSIRDTICSGVMSTSNFHTGLSSILAQRSQKELTMAATAKWRTPFSGPTQRSWPSWARSWTHFDMLPIKNTHNRKIEFHLIETLCWKSFQVLFRSLFTRNSFDLVKKTTFDQLKFDLTTFPIRKKNDSAFFSQLKDKAIHKKIGNWAI